jgi:hypothetical protein
LPSLAYPSEVFALIRFFSSYQAAHIPKTTSAAEQYSYVALTKTSRSFAAVILELHEELRMAVKNFFFFLIEKVNFFFFELTYFRLIRLPFFIWF